MLGPEGLLVNLFQSSTLKTLQEDLAELPEGRLSKYFTIKHELAFSYGSGAQRLRTTKLYFFLLYFYEHSFHLLYLKNKKIIELLLSPSSFYQ